MIHNEIYMANGWLHTLPAEASQRKQPAQKARTPWRHHLNAALLIALRTSRRWLNRSMTCLERKLCEQLA